MIGHSERFNSQGTISPSNKNLSWCKTESFAQKRLIIAIAWLNLWFKFNYLNSLRTLNFNPTVSMTTNQFNSKL